MYKHILSCVLVSGLVIGCGHNADPTGVGPSPVVTQPSAVVADTSGISCSTEPPIVRDPISVFGNRADIYWTSTAKTFEIEIVSLRTGNVAHLDPVTGLHTEWHSDSEGHYKVRVRPVPCGAEAGRWSDYVAFTLGDDNSNVSGGGSNGGNPIGIPNGGNSVNVCTNTVFTQGNGAIIPITALPGARMLDVVTKDADHRAGRQTDQVHEQLTVTVNGRVLGTTIDIPTDQPSQLTSFPFTGPATNVQLKHVGNVNSIHGACVTVR